MLCLQESVEWRSQVFLSLFNAWRLLRTHDFWSALVRFALCWSEGRMGDVEGRPVLMQDDGGGPSNSDVGRIGRLHSPVSYRLAAAGKRGAMVVGIRSRRLHFDTKLWAVPGRHDPLAERRPASPSKSATVAGVHRHVHRSG